MKKTLIALFCLTLLGFGENVQAQDDKKFHFGLAIEPSINWYSPSEEKKFESDGNPLKFGFGLVTDFKLGENIWFSTGLNITTGGGSIKYLENPTDGIGYYLLDNDILEPTGKFSDIDSTADFIVLDKRNYNANYVSIPLTLKMKTKEIGMMKYFGQFGFDVSIKTKGRADDEGTPLTTGNTPDLTDLNIDSEMQPLLAGLNIGAGAEYNISGSTSLVFSAN
ncbi:MAG: PorT family protein, partial [Crocinitomicaceae bacterium]|nr:PorT family protein [Crocinitomicaceae bacterium]